MINIKDHATGDTSYKPLIIILSIILFSSIFLAFNRSSFGLIAFTNYFMGLFFVFFSLFKLFNLEKFADGFQTYDVVAKHKRAYAYAYPFFELFLGLFYLSGYYLIFINVLTIILMAVSSIGVIQSLLSGAKIRCACLGNILNVPLSTVSLIENVGMGIMAFIMIFLVL